MYSQPNKFPGATLVLLTVAATIVLVLRPQLTSNNANSLIPHAASAPFQFCRVDISVDTVAVEDAYKKGEAIYSQIEVARAVGERRRRELRIVVALLEDNGLSTEKGEDCLYVNIGFVKSNSSFRQMELIHFKDYSGQLVSHTIWVEEYPGAREREQLKRLGYELQVDPISPSQLIVAAGRWRVPAEKQRQAVQVEKVRRREQANAAKAKASEEQVQLREQANAAKAKAVEGQVQLRKDLREKSLANCDAFEARVRSGKSTLTQEENEKYLSKCQEVRNGKLHDVWQQQ